MQKKPAINSQAIRFKQFSRKAYSVFNSLHKVVNTGVVSASVLLFANAENNSIGSIRKGCISFQPQGIDPEELEAFDEGLLLATPAPAATASANVGPVQQTDLSDEPALMTHWGQFIPTRIPYFWSTDHIFFQTLQIWRLFLPKSVNSGSTKFLPKELRPQINGTYPIRDLFSKTKKDKLCHSFLHCIQKLKDDIPSLPASILFYGKNGQANNFHAQFTI